MCGIAGGVSLRHGILPSEERVRSMSSCLLHRGPDGSGFWKAPSGRAILAHRRLSIIDLQSGAQPMVDASGAVGLSFNGEIYNYVELRERLAARGCGFKSSSDTEVLLNSYILDAEACVNSLLGMFAFAIWDDRRGCLLLARDRMGKKPLAFTIENDCLYFASSIEALRASSSRKPCVDQAGLAAYFSLGYIPAPLSAFTGFSKLAAASTCIVERGSAPIIARYWSPDDTFSAFEGSFEEAVDRLDELLTDAVRIRLRADVPLGVFLSGGVDSSLITAISAREFGNTVRSFAVAFDDHRFDESHYAREVARRLGTSHTTLRASPDLLTRLPRLVAELGEPLADPALLPLAALAEVTREQVTVALSGDGGDECFAGYQWHYNARRLRRITALLGWTGIFSLSRTAVQLGANQFGEAPFLSWLLRATSALCIQDPSQQYSHLRSLFSPSFLAPSPVTDASVLARCMEYTARAYRESQGTMLRRMRVTDLVTLLPESLMPKVDVATMSSALEARSPLLDHRVVEFALSLPDAHLHDRQGGKRPLRSLLGRYLPDSLVQRPKHGFSVPLNDWFAYDSPLLPQLTHSEALAALPGIDMAAIRQLVSEHSRGRRQQGERLYALLVLHEWASRL